MSFCRMTRRQIVFWKNFKDPGYIIYIPLPLIFKTAIQFPTCYISLAYYILGKNL